MGRLKALERFFGHHRLVLRLINDQQLGFCEASKIPDGDAWLVGIGAAALLVDRAEHFCGIVLIQESTGAVVDCLSGDCHFVRIHDAMNKAN